MIFKLLKLSIQKFGVGRPPTRVGQRVTLSNNCPRPPSEEYPVEGTSYECGGVVHAMSRRHKSARVRWHNDRVVELRLDILKVLSDVDYDNLMRRGFVADNPNFTFKSLMASRKKKKKSSWGHKSKYMSDSQHYFASPNSGNYDDAPPPNDWDE